MQNIATPQYNLPQHFLPFQESLYNSLTYLFNFFNINQKDARSIPISWKTFAIHHLAVKAAELENYSKCEFYINQITNIKNRKDAYTDTYPQLEALAHDGMNPDEINIIKSILEDNDKGIKVGFFQKKASAPLNELEKIRKAIQVIEDYDACQYQEINKYINGIFLTSDTDGYFVRSGSSFNLFGLIFLYGEEDNSIPYYIEHLVHECAHHALFITSAEDELVENPETELFNAPFRDDKRPVAGLYHAFFVLVRIYHCLWKVKNTFSGGEDDDIKDSLVTTKKRIVDTRKILEEHAIFTNLGREIYLSLNASIDF